MIFIFFLFSKSSDLRIDFYNVTPCYNNLSIQELESIYTVFILYHVFEYIKLNKIDIFEEYIKKYKDKDQQNSFCIFATDFVTKTYEKKEVLDHNMLQILPNVKKIFSGIKKMKLETEYKNGIIEILKKIKKEECVRSRKHFMVNLFFYFISKLLKSCEFSKVFFTDNIRLLKSFHCEKYVELTDDFKSRGLVSQLRLEIIRKNKLQDRNILFLNMRFFLIYFHYFNSFFDFFGITDLKNNENKNDVILFLVQKLTTDFLISKLGDDNDNFKLITNTEKNLLKIFIETNIGKNPRIYIDHLDFDVITDIIQYNLTRLFPDNQELINHFTLIFIRSYSEIYLKCMEFIWIEIIGRVIKACEDVNTIQKNSKSIIFIYKS